MLRGVAALLEGLDALEGTVCEQGELRVAVVLFDKVTNLFRWASKVHNPSVTSMEMLTSVV